MFTQTTVGILKCRVRERTRSRSCSPDTVGSVTANTRVAPVTEAITGHPIPGGAVHDDPRMIPFLGDPSGFPADRGDQLARVFGRNAQPGMNHGTAAGLRYHPFAAEPLREIDGFLRAEPDAHTTAFAGNRVNGEPRPVRGLPVHSHRTEPAVRQARPAIGTMILANDRFMATEEVMAFLYLWQKDKVQIRRIHVTVRDDGPVGQNGEACRHAGLARPALAADDNELFHAGESFPGLFSAPPAPGFS